MSQEFRDVVGLVVDVFRLDTERKSRAEWLDYLDIIANLLIAHAKDIEEQVEEFRVGWIVDNEV